MSTTLSLKQGQMVGPGRFTLIKELGRGGMGVVWLARDTHLGEQAALKFLPSEVCHDPVALNDLRRETVRSHRLTHPNIIRIHDFHQQPDGVAFISMEYVDGQTLSGWRLQQPRQVFAWDPLAPLVKQLCAALEYAHGEGVIHRDLKPANVMLDSRGRVKLADFGIAAVVSDSIGRVSARSTSGGTLAYMSPQQLEGSRPSVGDDVYALGASLYELLTGRPPFYSGDITHQVLHVAPTPIAERMLDFGVDNPVPAEVAALIMACLAKDPAQRPASAQAVAAWVGLTEQSVSPVDQFVAAVGVQAEPAAVVASAVAQAEETPSTGGNWLKPRWVWAVGGVVGCLLLIGLGWAVFGRKGGGTQDGTGATASAKASKDGKRVALPPEMQRSLVLYFSFDEAPSGKTVKDLSSAGNHGTVEGATWTAEGKLGGAYAFDKDHNTDRIVVRNSESLNPAHITLVAWIKSNDGGRTWGRIIDKDFRKGYCLNLKGPEGLTVNPEAGHAVVEIDFVCAPSTQTRVDDGRWHQLAATHDGSVQWIYLDGQPQRTGVKTKGAISTNSYDLAIGNSVVLYPASQFSPAGQPMPLDLWAFNGLIDEVMIFNRALTPEEVRRLFELTASLPPAPGAHPTGSVEHWTNSLGMIFVPVPATDVKFSIWEIRVQDFKAFAEDTGFKTENRILCLVEGSFQTREGYNWQNPGFLQTPTHPVVGVSWDDAQAFCQWLTAKEQRAGSLNAGMTYRLPTDLEWSGAAGLRSEIGDTPAERSKNKRAGSYYWGNQWPPPPHSGNFADETTQANGWPPNLRSISGYSDGFARTAPVGSFNPNHQGLYDLEGNVSEWCQDAFDPTGTTVVIRGGSWAAGDPEWTSSENRQWFSPANRRNHPNNVHAAAVGFRVVLASGTRINRPVSAVSIKLR